MADVDVILNHINIIASLNLFQEMSRFKEDAAMLRTKKMEMEREMVSLKQEHFLEKEELEDEIEKMREQHLVEKTELEKELEKMQQQSVTPKTDLLKQHDTEQKKQTKDEVTEVMICISRSNDVFSHNY